MKQLKWLSLFAVLLPLAAGAGQEGNGGDGILCSARGKQSVLLLDLYEARNVHGFNLDLGQPSLSVDQKIELALKRLERVDHSRAERLRDLAATFWQNAELTQNDLVDIPDSGRAQMPAGCQLKQAAIQSAPIAPGSKLYTIDKKLWALMDSDSKASLILHELVLHLVRDPSAPYAQRILRAFHADTQRVRYFVGWLTSQDPASVNLGRYAALQNLAALDSSMTYRDLDLSWSQIPDEQGGVVKGLPQFFDAAQTQLKSAYLINPSRFSISMGPAAQKLDFETAGEVSFSQIGKLRQIAVSDDHPSTHAKIQIPVMSGSLVWPHRDGPFQTFSEQFNFNDQEVLISLTSEGEFKNSYVETNGFFELERSGDQYYVSTVRDGLLTLHSQTYSIADGSTVSLYETGEPQQISGISVPLQTMYGTIESNAFELYRSGVVKNVFAKSVDHDISVLIAGVPTVIQGNNRVSFYEAGSLFSGVARSETLGLKDPAGAAVIVHAHERFNLDPKGAVTCVGASCL